MAHKKTARQKARAIAKTVETVAAKTEKRVEQSASGIGGWVKDHPLLTLIAAAAATAVAVAPVVAYAEAPGAPQTPAQIAQAQRDAQAHADQMNALKIGVGLFAFTAVATVVYAVTIEEPPKRPSGRSGYPSQAEADENWRRYKEQHPLVSLYGR